jgi:hypothetical protein
MNSGGPQGSNSGPLLFQIISDKQMTPQILQNSLILALYQCYFCFLKEFILAKYYPAVEEI